MTWGAPIASYGVPGSRDDRTARPCSRTSPDDPDYKTAGRDEEHHGDGGVSVVSV